MDADKLNIDEAQLKAVMAYMKEENNDEPSFGPSTWLPRAIWEFGSQKNPTLCIIWPFGG